MSFDFRWFTKIDGQRRHQSKKVCNIDLVSSLEPHNLSFSCFWESGLSMNTEKNSFISLKYISGVFARAFLRRFMILSMRTAAVGSLYPYVRSLSDLKRRSGHF